MTQENDLPEDGPYADPNVLKELRRTLHRIENKLEHVFEKLEECLEARTTSHENTIEEQDFYDGNEFED